MPSQQLFTIWGRGVGGINLSHGVGTGRSNLVGDVMLVQVLLNFIVEGTGDPSKVGARSVDDLPDVTGHWDSFFDKAVIAFQSKNSRLLREEAIGQISPVSDPFDLGEEDQWPGILLLNKFAEDATGFLRNRLIEETDGRDTGFPYPTSMLAMFPELRKHLV
ncbi:MAG: hypothetical protein H7070_16985 [Saprospiraceae bacterium]|nr:hypothetical protein [Pyrinomonadaceae bacterium]